MIHRIKLSDDFFPVEGFFNTMAPNKFRAALENFASGRGFNPEGFACSFPRDLEEDELKPAASFGYIEFWTISENEEVQVEFQAFLNYLDQAIRYDDEPELRALQLQIVKTVEGLTVAHQNYVEAPDIGS